MKRLVICIDGTWTQFYDQNRDEDVNWSNAHNIRILVAERDSSRHVPQIVHYIRGVGTYSTPGKEQPALIQKFKNLNRVLDGALGLGINELILDGYMCLCDNYEKGDEIFIFGFSRGAVAARALAGIVGLCGILKTDWIERLPRMWQFARSPQVTRESMQRDKEKGFNPANEQEVHQNVRIKCVGVWDTVRGDTLQKSEGRLTLRERFANALLQMTGSPGKLALKSTTIVKQELDGLMFASTDVPDNVDVALHAISLDEERVAFEPILWTTTRADAGKLVLKQVLFAGDHGSVGGGHGELEFSNVSLDWMIRNVERHTKLKFHTRHPRFAETPCAESIARVKPVDWSLQTAQRNFTVDYNGLRFDDEPILNCTLHASVLALHKNILRFPMIEDGKEVASLKPSEYSSQLLRGNNDRFPKEFIEDYELIDRWRLRFGDKDIKVEVGSKKSSRKPSKRGPAKK